MPLRLAKLYAPVLFPSGDTMRALHHQQFLKLHQVPGSLLLLPNAWDAASARIFEASGATAVATSSASLAWACGYADGGALPPEELLHAVRNITHVLKVPLTVDMEDGYSADPDQVGRLAAELAGTGAVGINIERRQRRTRAAGPTRYAPYAARSKARRCSSTPAPTSTCDGSRSRAARPRPALNA
jgi:hypothetical protein